jgi:hypothetical protein
VSRRRESVFLKPGALTSTAVRLLDQSALDRRDRGVWAVVDPQLVHRRVDLRFYRVPGDGRSGGLPIFGPGMQRCYCSLSCLPNQAPLPHVRPQAPLKPLASSKEAAHHGPERYSQSLRYFRMGKAVQIRQDEADAKSLRQASQRLKHLGPRPEPAIRVCRAG